MTRVEEDAFETFKLVELEKGFDLSSFDCGRPSLNGWLEKHAWASHKGGSAKTYVIIDGDCVVGYYSVCPAQIKVEDVVVRMAQGQPKAKPIPVLKITCLAVDADYQCKGLGEAMLKDALLRCLSAAETIGGRAVVVDAIDQDIISFYQRFGFEAGPKDEKTMMLMIKDLKKAYDES